MGRYYSKNPEEILLAINEKLKELGASLKERNDDFEKRLIALEKSPK